MTYQTLRQVDYTNLVTAADGNQIINNLDALVRRWGRGVGTGLYDVSFDVPANTTSYLSPAGTAVQIAPPNAPAHQTVLLVLAGTLRLTLSNEYVDIGLHVSGTPNLVTTTPLRVQRFLISTVGSRTYSLPVYLQAHVLVSGVSYAYPQIHAGEGVDTAITASNRFIGHLFVKEV